MASIDQVQQDSHDILQRSTASTVQSATGQTPDIQFSTVHQDDDGTNRAMKQLVALGQNLNQREIKEQTQFQKAENRRKINAGANAEELIAEQPFVNAIAGGGELAKDARAYSAQKFASEFTMKELQAIKDGKHTVDPEEYGKRASAEQAAIVENIRVTQGDQAANYMNAALTQSNTRTISEQHKQHQQYTVTKSLTDISDSLTSVSQEKGTFEHGTAGFKEAEARMENMVFSGKPSHLSDEMWASKLSVDAINLMTVTKDDTLFKLLEEQDGLTGQSMGEQMQPAERTAMHRAHNSFLASRKAAQKAVLDAQLKDTEAAIKLRGHETSDALINQAVQMKTASSSKVQGQAYKQKLLQERTKAKQTFVDKQAAGEGITAGNLNSVNVDNKTKDAALSDYQNTIMEGTDGSPASVLSAKMKIINTSAQPGISRLPPSTAATMRGALSAPYEGEDSIMTPEAKDQLVLAEELNRLNPALAKKTLGDATYTNFSKYLDMKQWGNQSPNQQRMALLGQIPKQPTTEVDSEAITEEIEDVATDLADTGFWPWQDDSDSTQVKQFMKDVVSTQTRLGDSQTEAMAMARIAAEKRFKPVSGKLVDLHGYDVPQLTSQYSGRPVTDMESALSNVVIARSLPAEWSEADVRLDPYTLEVELHKEGEVEVISLEELSITNDRMEQKKTFENGRPEGIQKATEAFIASNITEGRGTRVAKGLYVDNDEFKRIMSLPRIDRDRNIIQLYNTADEQAGGASFSRMVGDFVTGITGTSMEQAGWRSKSYGVPKGQQDIYNKMISATEESQLPGNKVDWDVMLTPLRTTTAYENLVDFANTTVDEAILGATADPQVGAEFMTVENFQAQARLQVDGDFGANSVAAKEFFDNNEFFENDVKSGVTLTEDMRPRIAQARRAAAEVGLLDNFLVTSGLREPTLSVNAFTSSKEKALEYNQTKYGAATEKYWAENATDQDKKEARAEFAELYSSSGGHASGTSFDLRANNMNQDSRLALEAELESNGFDVLIHGEGANVHFHVQ